MVMLELREINTLLMNQGVKYVEYVVNMKDGNVNNLCITLLPVSAVTAVNTALSSQNVTTISVKEIFRTNCM